MNIISSVIDTFRKKDTSLQVPLDEALLNTLLAKLVSESGGPIQNLSLGFFDGGFKAKARIVQTGITSTIDADFVLNKFEISPAQQVLVLHRSSALTIEGENWWSKIAVFVIQAIVSGILRDSMMGRFIGNTDAITVNDPEVSVNLGRLGIANKVIEAIVQKWFADNPLMKIMVIKLADKGGDALMHFVSITGAQCTESGVQLSIKLSGVE